MDIKTSKLIEEAYLDKNVQKIINDYNLSIEDLDSNKLLILSYYLNYKKCIKCQGLKKCQQQVTGRAPKIEYDGSHFSINFIPCKYLNQLAKETIENGNLQTYSCSIEEVTKEDLYRTNSRDVIYNRLGKIREAFENNENPKGLYLYGQCGCGKSYIMAYFARLVAKENHRVAFAYFPDLIRQIKSSIGKGNIEHLLEELKTVDILIIDDLGGIVMSSYVCDEILGAILQDRMVNKRLTFVTSNLDEKQLYQYLSESNNEIDYLRASRIIERIKALMDFCNLEGESLRY